MTNLEWCSEIYNHNYGTNILRISRKLGKRVVLDGVEYNSIKECRRETGHDRPYIKRHGKVLEK